MFSLIFSLKSAHELREQVDLLSTTVWNVYRAFWLFRGRLILSFLKSHIFTFSNLYNSFPNSNLLWHIPQPKINNQIIWQRDWTLICPLSGFSLFHHWLLENNGRALCRATNTPNLIFVMPSALLQFQRGVMMGPRLFALNLQ